jgi:hypothetical protein
MAITIAQAPNTLQPAYNDLNHVVTSTNYTQANFRYVCDLYVNGSSSFKRIKIPPDPTFGSGYFNPSRILEDYLTHDFDVSNIASYTCPNSLISYIVKFGEEYGLSSSGTTVYADLTVQSKKFIWNGVFDYEDYCNATFSNYQSGSTSSKMLTNAPDGKKVFIDSSTDSGNEFIYGINASSGDIYYLSVVTFDSSITPIGGYRIKNTDQALTNDTQKMVGFPCGINMNAISASNIDILTGTLPIITSSVYGYTLQFIKFNSTATSESKTYYIDRTCTRYPLYELYFLNKLGGYDTFSFLKKSNFKSEIKRETYKRNFGELTSATNYSINENQRGRKDYSTVIDDTITLRSDYINEETQNWLEELVTSPDIYMLRDGEHIPIQIVTSQFEREQTVNKKLFNLIIDIKFSYKRFRQRG